MRNRDVRLKRAPCLNSRHFRIEDKEQRRFVRVSSHVASLSFSLSHARRKITWRLEKKGIGEALPPRFLRGGKALGLMPRNYRCKERLRVERAAEGWKMRALAGHKGRARVSTRGEFDQKRPQQSQAVHLYIPSANINSRTVPHSFASTISSAFLRKRNQ